MLRLTAEIASAADLETAKIALEPLVPSDKRELLDTLHMTPDGGLAVTWHGITVRLEAFSGPGG